MSINISLTGPGLSKLNTFSREFDRAVQKGIEQAAEQVVQPAVSREIGAIYARPIPTNAQVAASRKSGKRLRNAGKTSKRASDKGNQPAWERSGNLQNGVFTNIGYHQAEIGIQGPAQKYAERRHELGKSWQPKQPAGNIVRKNTFMDDAVRKTSKQVEAAFSQTVKNELGI